MAALEGVYRFVYLAAFASWGIPKSSHGVGPEMAVLWLNLGKKLMSAFQGFYLSLLSSAKSRTLSMKFKQLVLALCCPEAKLFFCGSLPLGDPPGGHL